MTKNSETGHISEGGGILTRPDDATIAYRRLEGKTPGVVFLHGFHSDMEGSKALALEAMCQAQGRAFLRFDYFGHGKSSGDVALGTIGRWAADAVAVIGELTKGPQILVGSSLGGWIALLAALEMKDKVAGLVGVAAAPDFTEDLMWQDFTFEQRRTLMETGELELPNCHEPDNPWRIHRSLIEDGRNHLLLRDLIQIHCPVWLIQGQKDEDVPWQTALRLADCLASEQVEIVLVKDGDHRLSRDGDLIRLTNMVAAMLGMIQEL
ncbi:2-hydroxymuconic semialdehyde hydrolase [Paramagnetospirillum magnetotacticum MS-1]|uniref:Palmitoyl-protein thioesterase ABHD10, mitochondrial n=1 Tax=Paramagnetospirillum magnetotacticum MS-1 TaxID=272627 RepID=A0A0C2U9S2_PARME|nr:alpha/beta hydrolase [Paramagnetospirillum magnetotacticum]KIL98232.1 2-hydroxymuconic semialdehyde hydrolase [Paramagnetospirillum magnetotacticum MS-1]